MLGRVDQSRYLSGYILGIRQPGRSLWCDMAGKLTMARSGMKRSPSTRTNREDMFTAALGRCNNRTWAVSQFHFTCGSLDMALVGRGDGGSAGSAGPRPDAETRAKRRD